MRARRFIAQIRDPVCGPCFEPLAYTSMIPVHDRAEQGKDIFVVLRDDDNTGNFKILTTCCDVYVSGRNASWQIEKPPSVEIAGLTRGAPIALAMNQAFLGQEMPEILDRVVWISARMKARRLVGGDLVSDYLCCIPSAFDPQRRGRFVEFWLQRGVGSAIIFDQLKHLSARSFTFRGGEECSQAGDWTTYSLKSIRLRFSGGEWMKWHGFLAKILLKSDLRAKRTKVSIDIDDLEDFFEVFVSKTRR